MAEDFQFITPAPKETDSEKVRHDWFNEVELVISQIQERMVEEGIAGAGAGTRAVYLKDPDEMTQIEAPALQLYNVRNAGGPIDASTTSNFWTSIDRQGYSITPSWQPNQFQTLVNITNVRGVVGCIIGPRHTVSGTTVTLDITVDGFKRTRTFTHYLDGGASATRIVYLSSAIANWAKVGTTTANAGLEAFDALGAAVEDASIVMDKTVGEERIYYTSAEFFRLLNILEMQRRGMALLSFTRTCQIRMKTSVAPASTSLGDQVGVHMLAHRLVQ